MPKRNLVNPNNIIPNFKHEIGVHCGSTTIREMFLFDGVPVSEAMIFGLGSGLGFFYVKDAPSKPHHRFNGRCADLETSFYDRINQPIQWVGSWDENKLTDIILNKKRPVIAITDLNYIPYYEPVHFPGHSIAVIGVDHENQHVAVYDISNQELEYISFHHLESAVAVTAPPVMSVSHRWAEAPKISQDHFDQMLNSETLKQAILQSTQQLLNPNTHYEGFQAMQQLADDFSAWKNFDDWSLCARFAYQSIEKRGTGGSGFRVLYADFLAEATSYLPQLNQINAESQMRSSAILWSKLGSICKQIFAESKPELFDDCGKIVLDILNLEKNLIDNLVKTL